MGTRNPAEFEVALGRLWAWVGENASSHRDEHGTVRDEPSRILRTCSRCPSSFTLQSDSESGICPQCGAVAAPSRNLGPPPAGRECTHTVCTGGTCGYWKDCKKCGALSVLQDLEFALADREARSYAIEFSHEVSRRARAYSTEPNESRRALRLREFTAEIPKALEAFARGQVTHREQTRQRVRAQIDRLAEHGHSVSDVDTLFAAPPQIDLRMLVNAEVSYRDASGSFQCLQCHAVWQSDTYIDIDGLAAWWAPCPACGLYVLRELVNPHHSQREARVDPDRALLGALQEHLRTHGFTYSEIAHLTPDGEGGTEAQQRRRVEDRLRKRQTRK
jgi:hypothetical protein